MGPTTTTKKKKMANSEKKINALDIVSARSLGSLASVEGMFKGKKQQLTSYATFAIIVGSVAGLLFGFDQNLLNQVLNEPDFREAMSMPQAVDACGPGAAKEPMWVANRLGLIQSLYAIGCAFASPFAGAINDRLGRYKTLWVGLLIFFVGASLQTAASGYAMLMAGRLVAGASVGVLSSVVPVYIGELAPHHLQAALPPSSGFTWRIEVCFQLVFGLAMGVCMLFIPESPRWLCKSGQTDKARQVLKKLRGETSEEVTDAEMREIEVEVELESTYTGGVKDLFTKQGGKEENADRDFCLHFLDLAHRVHRDVDHRHQHQPSRRLRHCRSQLHLRGHICSGVGTKRLGDSQRGPSFEAQGQGQRLCHLQQLLLQLHRELHRSNCPELDRFRGQHDDLRVPHALELPRLVVDDAWNQGSSTGGDGGQVQQANRRVRQGQRH